MIFSLRHDAVGDIGDTANGDYETGWIGRVYWSEFGDDQKYWVGNYIDGGLLLIFGGIPWQVSLNK